MENSKNTQIKDINQIVSDKSSHINNQTNCCKNDNSDGKNFSTPSDESAKKVIRSKSSATKKREQQDFRRRYFDYYDDVKTNIKEDW